MNAAKFGSLEIGRIPRVVGTVCTFDSLIRLKTITEKSFDIAEVRLDHVGTSSEWLKECKLLHGAGTPIILTLRSAAEGGTSHFDNDQRKAIYETAFPVVSAIDVEFKSGLAEPLFPVSKALGKGLVSSYHDFEKTPSLDELVAIISDAQKHASVVKVSTFVTSPSDLKTLETLLQKDWAVPICVIGMGPIATSTRVSFPCSGSCLTYGYLDVPSAPGQLPARTLVDQLRKLLPAFNQDFVRRNHILESV